MALLNDKLESNEETHARGCAHGLQHQHPRHTFGDLLRYKQLKFSLIVRRTQRGNTHEASLACE